VTKRFWSIAAGLVCEPGGGGRVNPQNPINIYRGLGVNVDLGSTSKSV